MNAKLESINNIPITEAVEDLQRAVAILEQHANNPQNYNSDYANDFEVMSWEIYKYINDIKHIQNRYGVL